MAVILPTATAETIVQPTEAWKWLHPTDGADPAKADPDFHSTFFRPDFDDSKWQSGKDQKGPHGGFGYGEKDFKGVDIGQPANLTHRKTAYFRHRFTTKTGFDRLILSLQRDDGVIVYLDGREILRDNMPAGKNQYDLAAVTSVSETETFVERFELSAKIGPGDHLLAISLHNRGGGSSDLRVAEISLRGTVVVPLSKRLARIGAKVVVLRPPKDDPADPGVRIEGRGVLLQSAYRGGDAGTALLVELSKQRPFEQLDIVNDTITDAAMANLGKLTQLRWLRISRAPITAKGLALLKGLKKLEHLSLRGPRIDDAAVVTLANHPALAEVYLSFTQVGDPGMEHLKKLRQIRRLDLSRTRVTDAGLQQLSGMKTLRRLHLAGLPITDRGVAHLSGLAGLTRLNLSWTKITDAGLAHLKAMPALRHLDLRGCKVSAAAVAKLKESLPKLETVRR